MTTMDSIGMKVILDAEQEKKASVNAILRLEKLAFDEKCMHDYLTLLSTSQLEKTFENDIYSKFVGKLIAKDTFSMLNENSRQFQELKIDVICPASTFDILKYSMQALHIILETPELYNSVTVPFIDAHPIDRLTWVNNILEEKAEIEKILYSDRSFDSGFVLVHDR